MVRRQPGRRADRGVAPSSSTAIRARLTPGPLHGRATRFAEEPGWLGRHRCRAGPWCGSLGVVSSHVPYRPALAERHLRLPGTRNLRDVGGYPAGAGRETRWRTLLRTDALDQLPIASQRALHNLGVRQVIDVRWGHEVEGRPSVFRDLDAVRYRNLPLMPDEAVPDGIAATYRHMFDRRSTALAGIARALLEPGGLPAVIGCAAGVDRTGVSRCPAPVRGRRAGRRRRWGLCVVGRELCDRRRRQRARRLAWRGCHARLPTGVHARGT